VLKHGTAIELTGRLYLKKSNFLAQNLDVSQDLNIFAVSNKIYVDDAVALPQNGGAFLCSSTFRGK